MHMIGWRARINGRLVALNVKPLTPVLFAPPHAGPPKSSADAQCCDVVGQVSSDGITIAVQSATITKEAYTAQKRAFACPYDQAAEIGSTKYMVEQRSEFTSSHQKQATVSMHMLEHVEEVECLGSVGAGAEDYAFLVRKANLPPGVGGE